MVLIAGTVSSLGGTVASGAPTWRVIWLEVSIPGSLIQLCELRKHMKYAYELLSRCRSFRAATRFSARGEYRGGAASNHRTDLDGPLRLGTCKENKVHQVHSTVGGRPGSTDARLFDHR